MNWRKISLYILLSFAISWAVALVMRLAHVDMGTIPGKILIAVLYMPGPALATFVIQKFIYKEGFSQYGWTFDKMAMKWILLTPLLFLALTFLTLAIIGLFGNTQLIHEFGQLDFSQESFNLRIKEIVGAGIDVSKMRMPHIPPYLLFIVMLVVGIAAGATANLPFMFGGGIWLAWPVAEGNTAFRFSESKWFYRACMGHMALACDSYGA